MSALYVQRTFHIILKFCFALSVCLSRVLSYSLFVYSLSYASAHIYVFNWLFVLQLLTHWHILWQRFVLWSCSWWIRNCRTLTWESQFEEIWCYLRMLCSRHLLEAVERLFELADSSWMRSRLEAWWLYHVHLILFTLKKGVLDIHLMKVPTFWCCKCDYGLNGRHLCHRGKGFFVIDHVCLRVAFCSQVGLFSNWLCHQHCTSLYRSINNRLLSNDVCVNM